MKQRVNILEILHSIQPPPSPLSCHLPTSLTTTLEILAIWFLATKLEVSFLASGTQIWPSDIVLTLPHTVPFLSHGVFSLSTTPVPRSQYPSICLPYSFLSYFLTSVSIPDSFLSISPPNPPYVLTFEFKVQLRYRAPQISLPQPGCADSVVSRHSL